MHRLAVTARGSVMAVLVELHNTGDAAIGPEVQAVVEHALSDSLSHFPSADALRP
jgi:hypothetical protein